MYKIGWQTFCFVLVVALAMPGFVSCSINLIRDPFQLVHADAAGTQVFLGGSGTDRYQHAGVIRSYKPESVVMGNSWAANFYPTELESILGWEATYSLTLDGGSLYEQRRVLNFALGNAAVTHVLWLIGPELFEDNPQSEHRKTPFPDYLYNYSRWDDVQFYLTLPDNLSEYSQKKRYKQESINRESESLGSRIDPRDRSTEWGSLHASKFNRPLIIRDRIESEYDEANGQREHLQPLNAIVLSKAGTRMGHNSNRQNYDANMALNILPLIEQYPNVEFVFVIHPPVPLLYWQLRKMHSPDRYTTHLQMIAEFVRALGVHNNTHAFGFAGIHATGDLRLYKDKHHFHSVLNTYMLQQIGRGLGEIHDGNVCDYLLDFDHKVNQYDPGSDVWINLWQGKSATAGISNNEANKILETHTQALDPILTSSPGCASVQRPPEEPELP